MRASSITIRVKRCADIRGWSWWGLPPLLRWYVLALPAAALTLLGAVAAVHTTWHWPELYKFLVLMCCGIISVASTPRIMYSYPGLTRDFTAIWVLPAAILLPPFYAAVVPIPLLLTLHIYVHRGVVHRMVFTAATLSLCYGAASFMFRWFPGSFAGNSVGNGFHAFTWCIAVAACELVASRAQYFLILGAVKLSNPKVKLGRGERDREALQARFVEVDLAVLITLAVGLSPALVVIALPTVLLVRRFLVFPILEAQSRTDAKTGLLNVSTWESETEAELSRAVRLRKPLAIALIDIDHFKTVNDTYGHLVGDRVLKAIADALASTRDYDRVGRFGGEEFVILLAETTEEDACTVAQRLRADVAALAIPVDDRPDAPVVQVTISIGVTALAKGETSELTDLLAAADSALYHAKQSGRNCVAYAPPEQNMGLDAFRVELGTSRGGSPATAARAHASTPVQATSLLGNHRAVLVQSDQTALSLRQNRLLSAFVRRHRDTANSRPAP